MTLPKIDLPRYEHHLVGIDKKVKFHPFTLKEQKILLMAKESESVDDQISAMMQILELCTASKIKPMDLPFFDVEDLFLRIRCKSVGEISEMSYRDKTTEKVYNVKINLDDVKVVIPEDHEKKIMISDTIGVMMKYPTLGLMTDYDQDKIKEEDLIQHCVDYVFDDKEMYYFKDQSSEEVEEWLDSLDTHTLMKISNFFKTMPRLRHEVTIKLHSGDTETIKFEGLQSLFT